MKRISSIVFALAAILAPATADAVELRWDLQPGQKLRYELKEGLRRNSSFMGMNQEEEQRKTYEWTWEVISRAEDGTLHVAAVFDRVTVRFVSDGSTYDWDSAENAGCPAELRGFATLPGSRFEFGLSPSGRVTGLDGIDETVSGALGGDDDEGDDEDGDDEDDFEDELLGAEDLTDEAFENGLDDALNFLPETAVEEGEVWERTLEEEDDGLDIQVRLAVKLEKSEGDYEGVPASLIGIEGEVEFPIEEMSEDLPPGSELDLTEAVQRGQAWFDGANGRLLRVQNEMRVRMEIKAAGGAMNGSMNARGRVTLTLK